MEWRIPCQENRDGTDTLGRERANTQMERNWRIQLQQELLVNRQKLERQKSLKEMYINREKQTRQDLERLRKYSKPETLSTTSIASQVNSTIKQKKKKELHNDYEELKVAHMISDHKFTIALQDKKEKNQVLQEELDRLRASHQEISRRYEDQTLRARQEVDDLKRELEKEIKSRAEDKLLMQNFMAEQKALRQKMEKQTTPARRGC
ncbi:unnamed protein product [Pleuronectes platessa]|uniref:Uncharacterized protein n=1 Tax=Pleuronectes platessa TaxID=8262 RepID=A0A9N7TG68_PLEPL|nr:unnamed protein product [Pleuronectes platessa]